MHRFYVDEIQGDKAVVLDAEQLHYLKDVLRVKTKEEVIVSDGKGKDYAATVISIEKNQATMALKAIETKAPGKIMLTVACAIPKGSRMDDVIDQLTQLGVERIIPMMTERVIVKLDESKKASRLERWLKIAESASAQSQRSDIPAIEPITPFEKVVSNSGRYRIKLIPNLEGDRKPIKEIISGEHASSILVLIGPEGDFSPEEVELAKSKGFIPVSLGSTVLRVATAAVAVASYIRFTSDHGI
jgi:16S rRNA (uracil1498-N3)-methyltransferase